MDDINDLKNKARLHLVAEGWRSSLIEGKSGFLGCRDNVIYVLERHPLWVGALGADRFARKIVFLRDTPIGARAGDEWTDEFESAMGQWLLENCEIRIDNLTRIAEAVSHVALRNAFHPVQNFLTGLEWDGQPRLDIFAAGILGAENSEYSRLVGRWFLINMVRRILEPGCIMRSVPVLEGKQAIGKSTALRILGGKWFADTVLDLRSKDAFQSIQGVWVYEISELESFSRAEASAVKAFISSTEDNFRAPYERQNKKHKRQTIFAASTNSTEYLKDWTGNTRFWPLACNEIDLDALAGMREQLLAEACVYAKARERTYPDQAQQIGLFDMQQEQRTISHPWLDMVAEFLAQSTASEFTVREVMADGLKIDMHKINPQGGEAQRVGQILAKLGWEKTRNSARASRQWVWRRPVCPSVLGSVLGDEPSSDTIPF
jgi:putative DNA primase/helicase